jgi:phage-related protein
MTPPVLSDLTLQYTDTGVLMNGSDNTFPMIDVYSVKGLDSATFRTSTKDTEGQDGSTIEADFESSRTITIAGTVITSTGSALEPLLDQLKANFATSTTYKPFYFKAPGTSQRVVFCKCISGFRYDWDNFRRTASVKFQVMLQAGDPIIYGTVLNTGTGSLTTGLISGFSFPFAFSFGFGVTTVTPGTFVVYNNGNRPAPFNATITGTTTNPELHHEALNRSVALGLSVVSGSTLSIDFAKRTAMLDEQNVSGKVTKEGWFLLEPGPNQLRLLAGSAVASITVTAYDAWR